MRERHKQYGRQPMKIKINRNFANKMNSRSTIDALQLNTAGTDLRMRIWINDHTHCTAHMYFLSTQLTEMGIGIFSHSRWNGEVKVNEIWCIHQATTLTTMTMTMPTNNTF